jgi:hypothetical protein
MVPAGQVAHWAGAVREPTPLAAGQPGTDIEPDAPCWRGTLPHQAARWDIAADDLHHHQLATDAVISLLAMRRATYCQMIVEKG